MKNKTKYVTIELSTIGAYDEIDRLIGNGWRVIRNGLFSVTMASK